MSIKIFLDTSVYEKANFSFGNRHFSKLKELIEDSKVELLYNKIVYQEVCQHIKSNVIEAVSCFNQVIKENRAFAPFKYSEKWSNHVMVLDQDEMVSELQKRWDEYLNACNAKEIPINTVDIDDIIERYFNKRYPFENKKPYEFKDAIIVDSIRQFYYSIKNENIFVVAIDKGFRKSLKEDDGIETYADLSYTLQGILGMPEYCDGSRFPVDQISELCHLYPENDILFGTLSSMDLINMELSQNWELYVNWVTRECNFNSKRFREVLEGAYNLPEYRPSSREEVIDYATGAYLLGGKQIFMPYTVSDFEGYLMMTEGMNGSKVKLNPYGGNMVSLTLTDSEVVLDIRSSFAITNVCKNPDTAWEFLQTFLGLEYQKSLLTATAPALPINTLAFVAERNKLLAEGKGKKEDFDYIQGMIESAKTVVSSDLQIESIVYEEVSDYFANQKTAEDAAKIIQDRVSAYLKKY